MTSTRGKLEVTGFIFLGFKITVDSDCSHKIKRFLLLGRKAMTNLDSVLKSRDITLPKKVHIVKGMVFAVVVYGYESWTIEKAECQRSHSFELWCWRKLARRSNQSILKEISPEYSLERLMLKLKLQYFRHLMRRADSLGKDPDSGKDWEEEEKGTTEDEMDGITGSMNMILSKLWEILKDWEACHAAVHGVTKSQIWLSNWKTTTTKLLTHFYPPHFKGDGSMVLQGFAQTQHDIQKQLQSPFQFSLPFFLSLQVPWFMILWMIGSLQQTKYFALAWFCLFLPPGLTCLWISLPLGNLFPHTPSWN